jgi:hypothetical protein
MDSFKLDLGLKQQQISIFLKFCYFLIQQDIANIQIYFVNHLVLKMLTNVPSHVLLCIMRSNEKLG